MKKSEPLRKIPLFSALAERDRRKIAAEVTEAHYGKGEYIFREGDPANYFHIVKEGAVKCIKSSADGKECTLKVLLPGDLFCCEAAVFDGAPHPGTAQPMGDVSILRLNKKSYFEMLRRNPDAALEVIKYLGRRLNEAQETAKILALDRAEQRIAALLVNLASRSVVRESDGLLLPVRLTRQDLADMSGVTVETAIRIMSRFKRSKLVSGNARRIVIRDLSKLKQLASSHS
ncbi:MAG TPA: Crp/Fnr family transcriptional regulator [Nitrospiraceae bacterium]|nr:Crp/Fnr family transcriptional regulator [Nitrospiraceae bacterium]